MDKLTRRKRRRELNKKAFPSEVWFEKQLAKNGINRGYERNFCLLNSFFGDFVWLKLKLVVEIDGSSHTGKSVYDSERDAKLKAAGFEVVRIPFPCKSFVIRMFMDEFAEKLKKHSANCAKKAKNNPCPQNMAEHIATENNVRLLDDLKRRQQAFKEIQEERAFLRKMANKFQRTKFRR